MSIETYYRRLGAPPLMDIIRRIGCVSIWSSPGAYGQIIMLLLFRIHWAPYGARGCVGL
jgi:hypothetical protein